MEEDAELREKTDASGSKDTLVNNEMTRLQRQTKDRRVKKKTVKGILSHLMVDDPDAKDLLWCLPTNVIPFPGGKRD